MNEVTADPEGAGPAGSLHGAGPAGCDNVALCGEDQVLYKLVKAGDACDAEVALGILALENPLLSLLDAVQNRGLAVLSLEDADTEIDLVTSGVFLELLGKAEDRVCRSSCNFLKHGSPNQPKKTCSMILQNA